MDYEYLQRLVMLCSKEELEKEIMSNRLTSTELSALRDKYGMSLLEEAISYGNYEVCMYLIDMGVDINVVTREGYNEFHLISSKLGNDKKWLVPAHILLEKGVSLSQQDKKIKNTAMFDLFRNTAVKSLTDDEYMLFLKKCLAKSEGIYEKNVKGYCVVDLQRILRLGSAYSEQLQSSSETE